MTKLPTIGAPATVAIGAALFPATVTSATGSSVTVSASNGSHTFWWSKPAAAYKSGTLYTLTLN